MNSYYYGNPEKQEWSHVTDVFAAHESLNSERTSSLPLVQFWKDDKLNKRVSSLEKLCPGVKLLSAGSELYFEYGVSVPIRFGRGKASMTDLMIISNQHAIAVEAKYTEVTKRYESIKSWLNKNPQDNNDNKIKVLIGWLKYIFDADGFTTNPLKDWLKYIFDTVGSTPNPKDWLKYIFDTDGFTPNPEVREHISQIQTVPYQLIHRIASACAVANKKQVLPVVIYQIFYDDDTREKASKFAVNLRRWVKTLGLKSDFRFYAIGVPILKGPKKTTKPNDLFLQMKKDDVYTFGEPCEWQDIPNT